MKIVLTGFMGTGKSVVGRRLAERLALRFIDLDDAIEESAGMTISEIFACEGERGFRRRERELIASIADRTNCVVATGGGAMLDPDNVRNLRDQSILICLKAEPAVILERLGTDISRPLMQATDRLARIQELLQQRGPAYAQADFCIETSEASVDEIVERIMGQLHAASAAGVETEQ
jgi:shikimate kinase